MDHTERLYRIDALLHEQAVVPGLNRSAFSGGHRFGLGSKSRTARHQAGCGLVPSIAYLGGMTANTPRSNRRSGDHRSNVGDRKRSAVGEGSERPVFHPSNGGANHTERAPQGPGQFTIRF